MGARPFHVPARPQDDIHVPFVVAALLFGTFGGFALAVSLPVEGLLGGVDVSWVVHAQIHGHLQVVGFAGLFVAGVALRLAPRFGGRRDVAYPGAVRWMWGLWVAGLVGRAIGQPLATHTPFAVLLTAGAAAELVAAALFLLVIGRSLAAALRTVQPHAVLLLLAAVGLVAQAALGLWWLAELAADRREIVPRAEAAVLLQLQCFAFLLPAILGVGMRTFPTFFGRPAADPAAGRAAAALLAAGSLLWAAGGIVAARTDHAAWVWVDAGQALTGAAILGAIAMFGPWRRASRLAAASRRLAWAVHPALLWLAATGVVLIATAATAAAESREPGAVPADALRHLFAVGVVTLAVVGMAQLMLPEFASERLVGSPGGWRGPAFGGALSAAAALRGAVLLAGLEGDARWWAMAVAGVLGWSAVALFAALYRRARRGHRAYLARVERHPLPVVDRAPPPPAAPA